MKYNKLLVVSMAAVLSLSLAGCSSASNSSSSSSSSSNNGSVAVKELKGEELNKIEKIDIKTNVISLYVVQGEEEIMEIFGVDEKIDFYKVVRNRVLDGESLEYEVAYFDRRIVRFLNREIVQNSIYNYLENELQLKISHSRREIKFRNATCHEKKYLDLGDYKMVVSIENYVYLSNGTLFQYGITSYKPDKFVFSTMAKR